MARKIEPDCRQCRREGRKLFLKGERCTTKKCAMERRPVIPGQHGASRKRVTEYGLQLREKQKVKRMYGILEKQFRKYYEIISSSMYLQVEFYDETTDSYTTRTMYHTDLIYTPIKYQGREMIRFEQFSLIEH